MFSGARGYWIGAPVVVLDMLPTRPGRETEFFQGMPGSGLGQVSSVYAPAAALDMPITMTKFRGVLLVRGSLGECQGLDSGFLSPSCCI